MSKRCFWVIAVGACALLIVGVAVSSNMGFILNYPLDGPGTNGSNTGTNSIAFPFNNNTSMVAAEDVRSFVNATVPGAFVQISKFLQTNDSLQTYTGANLATNFFLEQGVGYRLVTNTDVNLIVVGSHDPTKSLTFDGPGAGSNSGTSDFAFPYHAAAETASDIRDEVNAVVPGAFVQISKFIKTDDSLRTYTGASNATDFALVMGESYRIVVSSDVTIVWSHY